MVHYAPMTNERSIVEGGLREAGIEIDGSNPWDIHVENDDFYRRLLGGGSLALGEMYMDGWWNAEALDQTIDRILRADLQNRIKPNLEVLFYLLRARLTNMQNRRRAFEVGERHYDIGNTLYEQMLDPWMQYSCGYWKNAQGLAEAQEAKMELIAQKLKLKAGMRVLDIGCGWGGLSRYLAERYEVEVTGITISKEQAAYAHERTGKLPVTYEIADYREFRAEPFDRIVSVGMFEHVGHKNYRTHLEHMHRLLADTGLFLLHSIGHNKTLYATNPWIDRYIFPNGMLPSAAQISTALENLFVLEDWHNFGAYYDPTLMAWHKNFQRAWPELQANHHYDERFHRMWEYYLLSCAGGFRSRKTTQLWQLVLAKPGVSGGYLSVR